MARSRHTAPVAWMRSSQAVGERLHTSGNLVLSLYAVTSGRAARHTHCGPAIRLTRDPCRHRASEGRGRPQRGGSDSMDPGRGSGPERQRLGGRPLRGIGPPRRIHIAKWGESGNQEGQLPLPRASAPSSHFRCRCHRAS
ncbi:hypothetical protein NDU88_008528 [Pleurodeles waltl]|uniref:Uncharacterized protein n=1 Tax=Pleurodeles waltl TaxID=8319 RepID=A0AAV7RXW9_PLEWA|nr:hypothetical protein NDU88_008528 [Pleurodeles waltl]